MQLGIALSTDTYMEEATFLTDFDFFEASLWGEQEVIDYSGIKGIQTAHLSGLNRGCSEDFDIAAGLNVEVAVIHLHTVTPTEHNEKMVALERLLARVEGHGITLCLENTEEEASFLLDVFTALPRLRFCLDMGHANLFSNDPLDFIDTLGYLLEHVHVHDNNGGDSEAYDIHLSPGEGGIDFERVFSALRGIGYDERMTLELPPVTACTEKLTA